jgi:hypothetical protein
MSTRYLQKQVKCHLACGESPYNAARTSPAIGECHPDAGKKCGDDSGCSLIGQTATRRPMTCYGE